MAVYSFAGWQLSDIVVSGPDPFSSNATANSDAVGVSSFTISPSASFVTLDISDDEANFHDGDSGQNLATSETFNGQSWPAGTSVETEYSYIIRPAGSLDPADNILIYSLEFNGDVIGIASSERLFAGQSYDIIAIDSQDPTVAYSAMAVCFAEGTLIATRRGPVPVERLRLGDAVLSSDNGYRELQWIGRWRVNGRGANAPVRIAAGVLGNDRRLEVSGQHRLVIRPQAGPYRGEEILTPAKALVGLTGVTLAPRPRVLWLHLMFDRHEIIFAEGARAESLLPGPQALAAMERTQARDLDALLGALPAPLAPARAIVPPGQMRRIAKRHSSARILGSEA